jgi:hypothetical protein
VRYAPAFDLKAFQEVAEREIRRMREGVNYLEKMDLSNFRKENSWETTQARFLEVLR